MRGPLVRPGNWGGDEPQKRKIRRLRRRRWEPSRRPPGAIQQHPGGLCARLLARFLERSARLGSPLGRTAFCRLGCAAASASSL